MDVNVRQAGQNADVHIVEIEGRIDAKTAADIENELNALKEKQAVKIIVDFSRVNYISSGGLRVFLSALKWAKAGNGDLKLVNMEQNVEKIFKLAGFTKIFNILPDIDSALSAF
ncbi:anti-sigma factor antagonist [Candidatus Moduliflexus flocculans]|uniref:Anti-sigma factor antagonist n=1 Tax=Candidatus Moduliflexus flocculans TaxID=1499966 RepID=A0A0S6W4Z8_9BACT|nr:anti-sigma factor antagonist [Candidatus Moduliflexus flocculans]